MKSFHPRASRRLFKVRNIGKLVLPLGKKQQEELEIATYTAVNMAEQY